MKKLLLLLAVEIIFTIQPKAQDVFICRNAAISFFSSAPIEDIAAQTSKAVSAINMQTGSVYFKVPIKTFKFPKSLMQEHFNTDYLESDQYPFAEFKGTILNYKRPGNGETYSVTVEGMLTIHGVTRNYKESGTLSIKDGKVAIVSSFKVRLADHNIKIPTIVFRNIAEVVDVKVNAIYAPQQETANSK
jgi:polyisoprenoid-binding protein YceI